MPWHIAHRSCCCLSLRGSRSCWTLAHVSLPSPLQGQRKHHPDVHTRAVMREHISEKGSPTIGQEKTMNKQYGEQKSDKEKSHKGIWWWEFPGSVPGIHSGCPRYTRDVWADLCGNSHSRGRMSAGQMTGQMGHVHGTDGTQTRGCPAKILYVYWFFLPPSKHKNVFFTGLSRNFPGIVGMSQHVPEIFQELY